MSLAAGTRLDSYEIVAPLGAGGMGEVYRARDTALKRDVAIKVLPEYWLHDPERLRRFELEAQAAATLNHPNVVSIFHVGRYDGSPYIVTELLQGETLRDRMRHGPMPLREVLEAGNNIAQGLAAAHDVGVIHRDLKPENVFLTKDGRVKILDFGLAKLDLVKATGTDGQTITLEQQTSPGRVLGTVGYMSPEQVRGVPADARSDIFALGVILDEMLTGRPAFRKETSAETMTAILKEDPPPISQLSSTTSPALQRVITHCLMKKPDQRFQHASDLAFALEAMSDSGTSTSMILEKAPASRGLWTAVVIAAIAVAAAIVAWWRTPPAVPLVESITQLTDDGEDKLTGGSAVIATDGARIYFSEGPTSSMRLAQVAVTGGRTGYVDTGQSDAVLQGITPDGSALLAFLNTSNHVEFPLWSVPIPAGEPRRLGDMNAAQATYFPDGRLLLIKGSGVFVADKDGSNPHHLATLNGYIWYPAVSPDGKRIVVNVNPLGKGAEIELAADGSAPPRTVGEGIMDADWSPDGKYLIYGTPGNMAGSDLWALPMQRGWFHRISKPVRLTNGALLFAGVHPSRDGKRLFSIGSKPRSELVRFDEKTHQFQPFLAGVSAISPTFSADGKWLEYTSYPDHTLWRMRPDGTERMQLTFPPLEVSYPNISRDGTKVSFGDERGEIYVVSLNGGSPEVVDSHCASALWSPDGNLLVLTCWHERTNDRNAWYLKLYDRRTRKSSELTGSEGLLGGAFVTEDILLAMNLDATEFSTLDLRTQQWRHLLSGHFENYAITRDGKYLIFTTRGSDPQIQRLRFLDGHVETLASLKGLRRVVDTVEGQTQLTLAPDGSPILARDIGTQEIYALTVKWP